MKLTDVTLLPEKMEILLNIPLIKCNFDYILSDFERVYKEVLNQEMPENIPEEHLRQLKSDIFTAFCHGIKEATHMESAFRQNFTLPPEIMEQLAKPKIIQPDKKIIV